jgi:hypothetical protein
LIRAIRFFCTVNRFRPKNFLIGGYVFLNGGISILYDNHVTSQENIKSRGFFYASCHMRFAAERRAYYGGVCGVLDEEVARVQR